MKELWIKIAYSEEEKANGLMFVRNMPLNHGMLFDFDRDKDLSFWGKNTYIPLDIAFISSDMRINKISSINPHDLSPVKTSEKARYALEVNSGYFSFNGIKEGDIIDIKTNSNIGQYIVFNKNNILKTSQTENNNQLPKEELPDSDYNLPEIDEADLVKILEDSYDPKDEPVNPQPVKIETPEGKKEEVKPIQSLPQAEEDKVKLKYPQFDNVFDACAWAIKNQESMRISYTTIKKRNLIRDVEPHGMFFAKTSKRQILVVYDKSVGDIRAFVVRNISKYAFMNQKFNKRFVLSTLKGGHS